MMKNDARETVFALSTPPGRSAIAVIRITGPHSGAALLALCGGLPRPRHARLCRLKDPKSGLLLDEALVLWFPGPASFTGEDMAELHLHGGRAVMSGVLDALAALPDLSPAQPGDFTRRAFLCGKLDLAQAEGLADLIDAETEAQRHQALRQQGGALTARVEEWRGALIRLMALAEAGIDFSDEDLPAGLEEQILGEGRQLLKALRRHIEMARRGERVREGYRVALLGEPNAGKSSLLNAIAQRDVAIVTEEPGTTRDILEVHLDLKGYAVTLADMAGIRAQAGRVETLGIERARLWAQDADLRIFLTPPGTVLTPELVSLCQPRDLICASKSDLTDIARDDAGDKIMSVSAKTGEGVEALLDRIADHVMADLDAVDSVLVTRLRHKLALEDCASSLERGLSGGKLPELQAEDFRLAARALSRITGRVDVEDVLDVIFRSFCIGK